MNKEILAVVDVVSSEKGVSKDVIFEAIEAALAMATKKRNREDIESRVVIDRETGNYETFRCWEVMDNDEEIEFPSRQIKFKDSQEDNACWKEIQYCKMYLIKNRNNVDRLYENLLLLS